MMGGQKDRRQQCINSRKYMRKGGHNATCASFASGGTGGLAHKSASYSVVMKIGKEVLYENRMEMMAFLCMFHKNAQRQADWC